MRNITIFALSLETHSAAKIIFAVGEKDEGAKTTANEIIHFEFLLIRARFGGILSP
jgi:hypothetical protein